MLLLSTSSLKWYWLHKIFKFAKDASYDWLDIALDINNYDLWNADYIYNLSKGFGMPVLSITAPSTWMDEKKIDKIMIIAKKLWVQNITFSPPHFSDRDTKWFKLYLPRIKRNTNIGISIQNVEPKFIFFVIPEHKNATLFEIKRITWTTTLDLSSVDHSSSMDILKAQKILWSSIKNILLSDRQWAKGWLLPWWAWWGISYLPLESFLMKLKTSWYNGILTLKIKPSEMWVWNDEKVSENLEYMKIYYKKHFLNF